MYQCSHYITINLLGDKNKIIKNVLHHNDLNASETKLSFNDAIFSYKKIFNDGIIKTFSVGPVSIFVKKGDIWGIVGPVGSGKSTLLYGLMGEIYIFNTTLEQGGINGPRSPSSGHDSVNSVSQAIAFCSQIPSLPSETIRGCILMGSPFLKVKYDSKIAFYVS